MQRSAVRPSPVFFGILAATIAGGVLAAVGDQSTLFTLHHDPLIVGGVFILVIAGWALSLTLHEFGHAIVAFKGGDHEVALKGYLSMDVRKYTDPVFSLVIPLLLLAVGGIPLPGGAVWINNWALRSRAVSSWVSLAGPLTNLGFGIVLSVGVAYIPGIPIGLVCGLSYLALLQILTFVLNILPVPGLDGYGAIEPYLSPQARELGAKARPWAPLVLFALLLAVPFVRDAFFDLSRLVFDAIGGEATFANFGGSLFQFWQ
ncbi:site-2 protease family protein [Amycolatopsis sp. CA-230715]|uniref:site-2 protease family protein n=1 Tax=Amycolatopsis sp. CA-230715 TaxID=2745196 RepID=UPI001C01C00F|nr:site-2 protease family protein [Amycolatopsis sp. CA-230715]